MELATYEKLIEQHIDDLFSLALRLCGNKETAEDLVQDVFLNLDMKPFENNNVRNPRAWLASILYRRYVDLWRKETRSPIRSSDTFEVEVAFERLTAYSESCDDPSRQIEIDCQLSRVQWGLDRLSEDHRQLIILHDIEGYTLGEVAQMLVTPIGTLKSRLHRARNALQRSINYGDDKPQAHLDVTQVKRREKLTP